GREAGMTAPPGSRFAGQVVRFAAPLLRIRYPDGVYVGLTGFPEWTPYARAVVELPPPPPAAAADQVRVVDVLTANAVLAKTGDPLWEHVDGAGPVSTPDGWAWAHLGASRQIALLPVEAYAGFRHAGGIATLGLPRRADSEPSPEAATVPVVPAGTATGQDLTGQDLAALERSLGAPLPPGYREFLASTNGGRPGMPAISPGFGFLADQSFFGFGRRDWFRNVDYVRQWLSDRFTDDFLPVGHVQGGTLAVRLRGPDAGSVWYHDDDDPRDDDSYDVSVVTANLLRRCADNFAGFLSSLRPVPGEWWRAARLLADDGRVRLVTGPGQGLALPTDRRAPAEQGEA
ncbi:MAG TPA: SMI1/KNR4 family protein, partial [Micromonosporaceae bacterium]|nr:SMI1/KNR4 family protein [Micromonosporaceae bacterium]